MAERAERYSGVSIFLHWLVVVLVVAQVLIGLGMDSDRSLFPLHLSVGVTIFAVMLVRLAWRLANPWPPLPSAMPGWERLFARGTHVAFYVLLLVVPLGGWAAWSARPESADIAVWGIIPWPKLPVPRSEELAESIGAIHGAAVWVVVGLLVLHVAGAFRNQFVARNGILARMLPFLKTGQSSAP